MSRLVSYGTGVLIVLATACVGGDDRTAGSEGLHFTTRSDTALVGTFAHEGSRVTFDSRADGELGVELHLQVNAFAYDVRVDGATGTVDLDGHDGALAVEDREAMIALEQALQPAIAFDASTPPHELALVRASMQLSDGPVGLAFTPRVVAMTDASTSRDLGTTASYDGCYVGGEDGIWYLPACNAWNLAEHDADGGGHCMIGQWIYSGPYAWECMGRCGSGCGYPAYTYDCLDHDQCCSEHGGCWDGGNPACGDEYWEAADDWWGAWWTNCG